MQQEEEEAKRKEQLEGYLRTYYTDSFLFCNIFFY